MKAVELAAGKWRGILVALGVSADVLDGEHHPCPKGEGKDRFRFADRNGSGNYFCACSDGTKGGMGLLMCCRGLSYADAAKEVERVAGTSVPVPQRAAKDPRIALNAARKLMQPAGDEVRRYLSSRMIEPTPAIKQARMWYWHAGQKVGEFDAMVATVSAPDGHPLTYHVTYLKDGRKAPLDPARKIMTPIKPISGGAIRLFPAAEEMGVAEGIETALAASSLWHMPVWSCVSDGLLAAFDPPSEVRKLWVMGDHDANYAGQAAAYALAKRMALKGIECNVLIPNKRGDWADVLAESQQVAA